MERKLGGWWRLWIAVTGIWVCGAGFVTAMVWDESPTTEELARDGLFIACHPDMLKKSPAEVEELTKDFSVAYGSKLSNVEWLATRQEAAKKCLAAKTRDWSKVADKDRRETLTAGALATLIPPLVLLLAGLLLRWIWNGFRPSKAN